MKTLKVFFVLLFLLFFSPSLSWGQGIPSVNNWRFLSGVDIVDSSKTKSFFSSNSKSQIFASYGKTINNGGWFFQTAWVKNFFSSFSTPDTVFLDCRFLSGTGNIIWIEVYLGLANSNIDYFDGSQRQFISLNSVRKILYWDMKKVKEAGLTSFFKVYLYFVVVTAESTYVGANTETYVLGGFYNNPRRTGIYDNFGDITDVPRGNSVPTEFKLEQNYPNPFNPSTKIRFSIPESGNYTLKVYNVLGQEVETLIDAYLAPGVQEYSFDGSNLPSGTYLYRLSGNGISLSNKMSLVK